MTTITIPGFIHAKPVQAWEEGDGPDIHRGFALSFWKFGDMKDQGYVRVCDAQVTVELPDNWDPREGQIEALRAKETALRAEFHRRVTEIHAQINKLQAIEMVGAGAHGGAA